MLSRGPVVLAAALLSLAAGGCALDDDPKRDAPVVNVPDDPFALEAGSGAKAGDGGEFSAEDVVNAYGERIGLPLVAGDELPVGGVPLTPPPGPPHAPAAPDLGQFSLHVLPDEGTAEDFVAQSGLEQEEIASEPGVRFLQGPGGVAAQALVGNVLLEWSADALEETDERFQRLVDPLESLAGEAVERPSMRPCEELAAPDDASGAAPPSGRTCRLGPQVVTFADPETTLSFGGVEVELVGVGPGGLKGPETYDVLPNPREAKEKGKPRPIKSKQGQFLALRLKVDNGTEEPLENLQAGLVINGVLHGADLANSFYVDKEPAAPFPLAPGDEKEWLLLFDLPGPALNELTAPDTALVFVDPRNPHVEQTPGSAPTVTRLRLFK